MAFKIYKNKITKHPSVSIKQNDKKHWFNLPMSHSKPNDSYIKTNIFIINNNHKKRNNQESYVRKYVRKDKMGVRGHPYNEILFDQNAENEIKKYLKTKYKKR